MDHLRADVARVVSSLCDLNRRSEPEFVHLGDGLSEVMDKVEQTHGEISRVLAMIQNDQEGGILHNIAAFQEEVSDRFDTNAETIRFCLGQLDESMVRLRELETLNKSFAEGVARMNAIGIYFAIEITRSPMALQVFSTFANDIRALFGEIFQSMAKIGAETERNIKIQDAAIRLTGKNHASIARDARESLRESAGTIDRASSMSAETLERITKYFSLLEVNVGHILIAIQVGDITRQQIEHVIEALTSTPPPPSPDGRPDIEWCRLVSLQFAQLRHVRTELTDAQTTIQEALEQISTVFGVLAADVDELLSGARTVTGAPDWITEITTELEKMWELEKRTDSIFTNTLGTIDDVRGALSQLQRHVHQIGDNNRRLGLEAYNARILSMRLGAEGRALTTLAKEVSELSHTTRVYTDAVAGAITAIVSVADSAGDRIQSVRSGQGLDDTAAAGSERAGIDKLERETGEFVRLTSDACGKARNILADMDGLQKTLQAIDGIQEQLEQTLSVLGSVVETLSAAVGETLGGDSWVSEQHAERYTMDAERRIHQSLTSRMEAGTVESSMSLRQDMVVNEDEMGENVELF